MVCFIISTSLSSSTWNFTFQLDGDCLRFVGKDVPFLMAGTLVITGF